jgi:hypothetical protein
MIRWKPGVGAAGPLLIAADQSLLAVEPDDQSGPEHVDVDAARAQH